jgi:hypothetical protein
MISRRIRKTRQQAGLRRQVAFFTLSQDHEPEEHFIDPASAHHDEMLATLPPLSPRLQLKHRDQLEFWRVAPLPTEALTRPRRFASR